MDKDKLGAKGACPLESISSTFQSLDTVRALHQTVVSLRSALEEAKYEIQRLRSQITVQSDIKEGGQSNGAPPILSKEVKPLPKKSEHDSLESMTETEIRKQHIEEIVEKKLPDTIQKKAGIPTNNIETINSTHKISQSTLQKTEKKSRFSIIPDISVVAHPRSSDNSMASKIDVKIKLMSAYESKSDRNTENQPDTSLYKMDDNISNINNETFQNSNIPKTKSEGGSVDIVQSSTENINIDDNDNSLSDGDNSVFMDSNIQQEEKTSDKTLCVDKEQEGKEEVDDIELIFSPEESREVIQEDMVSISEYDPWQNAGTSGTPVLVKFSSLPSEQGPGLIKTVTKIPSSTSHDIFLESDVPNYHTQKSLESGDSFDNTRSMKSSSLDKDNSEDQKDELQPLDRDESFDFFENRDSTGIGRKWTNYNVLVETDISKCGIIEESTYEMYHRRNTCPNPPSYRPTQKRESIGTTRQIPARLTSKGTRRYQYTQGTANLGQSPRTDMLDKGGPKRSSSAQTEISALPSFWKSESQLVGDRYHVGGPCTLPSKFVPTIVSGCHKHSLRSSNRTQEARRVLLSDINFTSMVPELSRSADHLCQDEDRQDQSNQQSSRYYKGNLLQTPDNVLKGITPSVSLTSPCVSQWTVNESSFGTQTIQTAESWGKRGDSFDSCRSYSTGSRYSGLNRHHRSRSVPSIRCAVCRLAHGSQGIRTSESMHYTPRVTFQEPVSKIRGSLPDLRHDCVCSRRYTGRSIFTIHGDSSGSTESLLDEADAFVRKSLDSSISVDDSTNVTGKQANLRRMSETDIQRDYVPSKQLLPFLPKTAKCLKPGHLAKVISKTGRVVVGRVRYVGPLALNGGKLSDELYVGVQLQSKFGDCDGTFDGRKFFECEPLHGLFVPFKKVVMAWTG